MSKKSGNWNRLSIPDSGEVSNAKTEQQIYEAADKVLDSGAEEDSNEDTDAELGKYQFSAGEADEVEPEEEFTSEEAEPEADEEAEEAPAPKDQPKKSRSEKRIHQVIEKLKAKDEILAQVRTQALREKEDYEQRIADYEAALASTIGTSAEEKIKAAKERLRKAKNEADTEAEIDATADLQEAYAYKGRAEEMKLNLPNKRETRQFSNEAVLADYKVKAWGETNKHILSSPVLMELALKVDSDVRKEGFQPHTDDYYEEVNKRVNAVYKQRGLDVKAKSIYSFAYDEDETDEESVAAAVPETTKTQPAKVAPKKVNPMSIGPKSTQGPLKKTVGKVSPQEQAFANRMGVPSDVLFKQQRLSEQKNKFGYSPVYIPSKKK